MPLSDDEYARADATALAALVHAREVSAAELLEVALRRIEALNPALNAVVALEPGLARRDAALPVPDDAPFAGVPFLAKDINVDVAGFRRTNACRFFADVPPAQEDSALARRWREAGLILAGRSNTPEFATDFGCEPELFGPTANPWDTARTPGGSSGGAAAAVASGMVPMAHATDSGGSIRVPAACCGLFGFKPGAGIVATGAAMGPLVGGLNVDHVVTWSVRDSARLLAGTARPEAGAPVPHVPPFGHGAPDLSPPGPLRIGVTAHAPTGETPDAETRKALDTTRALLEDLGHRTIEWHWPDDIDPFDSAMAFWASELASLIDARAEALGRPPRDDELGPVTRWAAEYAHRQSAVGVVGARIRMQTIRARVAAAMHGIDMLLTPVVSEPPLQTGLLTRLAEQDVNAWAERAFAFAPYTEIFNLTGHPAMSVPLCQSDAGLPIGLQFAGHIGQDALLLRLAAQLEEASPWRDRRPSLPVS